jgi:hypothetical protein
MIGITRRDCFPLLTLALALLLMIIGSWQRWTQPMIDHGREMNVPARILSGERLYLDVQCLYGPFASYFNASLYKTFGIRLAVLESSGAVCAALILLLIYIIARQLLGPWESALAAGLTLVLCAIKLTANYLQPYAYAALYGLVFSLVSLLATMLYKRMQRVSWLVWSGVAIGLVLISKPEVSAAPIAAAATAILLQSLTARRVLWRHILLIAIPTLSIPAIVYGYLLTYIPWRVLVDENHLLFTNMPPQLVYFNRWITGFNNPARSLAYSVSSIGIWVTWVGLMALCGAIAASRREREWKRAALRALALVAGGLLWWLVVVAPFHDRIDSSPIGAAPLITLAVIAFICLELYRAGWMPDRLSIGRHILLIVSVFASVACLRGGLNVKAASPYTPFFLPLLVIVYVFLILEEVPLRIAASVQARQWIRVGNMVVMCLMILAIGGNSIYRFRSRKTYEIKAARGRYLTEPPLGEPISGALDYIRSHTAPGDELLVLPQATSINFFSERRYPFFEEIIHPGFLTGEREARAIQEFDRRRIPLILVCNVASPEMRDKAFGIDYNQPLMHWIRENYRLAARFDSSFSKESEFGDHPLFILAYELSQKP